MLKRWGEGASLIRGEWKGRKANEDGEDSGDSAIEADPPGSDGEPQARVATANGHESRLREAAKGDDAIDSLLDGMGSLSLVPSSIKFGRGGNKGGFSGNSEGRGRGRGRGGARFRGRAT